MAVPDFKETVVSIIKEFLYENVYTSIPAVIISVDDYESKQQIDVQPLIPKFYEDGGGTVLNLGVVNNVPVELPSGGGALISVPLKVGDTVDLHFSMKSIEEWKNSDGSSQLPKDNRFFSLADAKAIIGLTTSQNTLNPNPDDVEIKFNGSSFKLRADVNGNGTELTTNADIVLNAGGNIEATCTDLSVTASGDSTITTTGTTTIESSGNLSVESTGGSISIESLTTCDITANTTCNITATTAANITAPAIGLNGSITGTGTGGPGTGTGTLDMASVALGVGGGSTGIARLGDQITVTIPGGSSAGTYTGTITTASAVNTSI